MRLLFCGLVLGGWIGWVLWLQRVKRVVDSTDVYDAYRVIVGRPDPVDITMPGRKYTQAGDSARRDLLKRDLERAYLRHTLVDSGREDASIVSVRRSARLRLVQQERKRTA